MDGVFRILDGVFDVWVVVFCIAVGRSHQWSGLLYIIMSPAFQICVLAETIFSETFVAFRVSVNHYVCPPQDSKRIHIGHICLFNCIGICPVRQMNCIFLHFY